MNANRHLRNYPLPSRIASALTAADRMAVLMNRHGQPAPDVIELCPDDYRDVDSLVSSLTHGAIHAVHVTWNGRRLCAA